MRGGTATRAAIGLGLSAIAAAGCALPSPSQPPEPPSIEIAGLPAEVRLGSTIEYEFADGESRRIDPNGWRVITPHGWSGELVIIGIDEAGQFVASFARQGGLPDDCYVENEMGIDRGDHIETRGILWRKAASFTPAEAVRRDASYPSGTRFCFTEHGEISSTVAP
ncbi:MAG TPA: hypothetical protein VLA59_00265 [Patescibacteria group bacterium]|nr:hypothetical protein [Patescibacteria group bacterium]